MLFFPLWAELCPHGKPWQSPGLFAFPAMPRVRSHAGLSCFKGRWAMLSAASNLVAGAPPAVWVVAGTALVMVAIVAWVVREVAVRAIDKASPHEVAAVISALASLVSAFRWVWPWSAKATTPRRQGDNDSGSNGPSAGEQQ